MLAFNLKIEISDHAGFLSDCDDCDVSEMSACPQHPVITVPNAVPFDYSLFGEPECVSLYRSGIDPSKVGAHAIASLPRNTLFGPLLDGEEVRGTPCSKWMEVSAVDVCKGIASPSMCSLSVTDV